MPKIKRKPMPKEHLAPIDFRTVERSVNVCDGCFFHDYRNQMLCVKFPVELIKGAGGVGECENRIFVLKDK